LPNIRRTVVLTSLLLLGAAACTPTSNDPDPPSDGAGGSGKGGKGGGSGGSSARGGSDSGGSGGSSSGGSGGNNSGGATNPDSGSPGSGGSAGGDAGTDVGGPVEEDCTATPKSLLCDPVQKMPKSIKDLGIFPSAPDFSKHPARLIEYVPDPPLYSDGMEKQRFLLLPKGKKIDNTNRKVWMFPEGTVFIKTFFDDAAGGKLRPIETRFIRTGGVFEYEFFVYQWNATGTDAALVVSDIDGDINKDVSVPITISHMEDGKMLTINGGQPFQHTLPSRQACGNCHEESGMVGQTFIGFDEIRLNSKFPATAPKTQLQQLGDAGIFTTAVPATPTAITDANPLLLRVKRFVFGNCAHCHNGRTVFNMAPDVFVANTVGKMTEAQSVVPPKGWLRVVPGSPDTSVVYVQAERTKLPPPVVVDGMETRLRPMPPVGVADIAVPVDAVADLRAWIMSLKK
jgi:hypothetical protein